MHGIAEWGYQITGRRAMHSPGVPSLQHEIERRFWNQIATGLTSERAVETVGMSSAVGSRWFRYRGGMPLFMSNPISDRYLSSAEREEIGLLSAQNIGVREIARRIGRSPSTVSRELARNASTRGGHLEYRASVAQWKVEHFAKRPKPAKLVVNRRLHSYVQERLEDKVCAQMAVRLPPPSRHRSRGGINRIAETESGSMVGPRNRSPTANGSNSPMMNPCAFLTKPVARLFTFKDVGHSSAS